MDKIVRNKSIMEGKGENNEVKWVTINGAHIPIKAGESKENIFKKTI